MLAECNQAYIDSGIGSFSPPPETVATVIFMNYTDKSIDHAVAMKRYNGLGGTGNGEYCEWENNLKTWQFNRLNDYHPPFNYVERVCQTYP